MKSIWEPAIELDTSQRYAIVGSDSGIFHVIYQLKQLGVVKWIVVEDRKDVEDCKDTICIVLEKENRRENDILRDDLRFKIRDEIGKEQPVYIYGAGSSGKRSLKILIENGIRIEGFIDKYKGGAEVSIDGNNVYGIDDLPQHPIDVIFSLGIYETAISEWMLARAGDNIFVDYANSEFYSITPLKEKLLV